MITYCAIRHVRAQHRGTLPGATPPGVAVALWEHTLGRPNGVGGVDMSEQMRVGAHL
jgi:hypothetical protein